jgi:phenol 2-monooxygenase
MPVFTENSGQDRDARILPSRELPLPRISQRPTTVNTTEEHREAVVIGVRSTRHTIPSILTNNYTY